MKQPLNCYDSQLSQIVGRRDLSGTHSALLMRDHQASALSMHHGKADLNQSGSGLNFLEGGGGPSHVIANQSNYASNIHSIQHERRNTETIM